MGGARSRNVGWRINYFLISAALRPRLKRAFIQSKVLGSDHCPVGIEIKSWRPSPVRRWDRPRRVVTVHSQIAQDHRLLYDVVLLKRQP